jgi:hypothetical protein
MYHFVFVSLDNVHDSAERRNHIDVNGAVREHWVLEWHAAYLIGKFESKKL